MEKKNHSTQWPKAEKPSSRSHSEDRQRRRKQTQVLFLALFWVGTILFGILNVQLVAHPIRREGTVNKKVTVQQNTSETVMHGATVTLEITDMPEKQAMPIEVPRENRKENRLMEFHAAAGVPMFNIPELLDVRIDTYDFQTTLSGAPADAWDVSQDRDGSVLAWLVRDGSKRHMIIAADGIIKAPQNCHGMFHNQSGTKAIRFNDSLDTSEVTDMSDMFAMCRSLTELDLSGFNTSSVMDMSSMFCFCESIKTLELGSFDTSGVKKMSEMFWGCYELENIYIDAFDTTSATELEMMFDGCINLDISRIPFVGNRGSSNAMKANDEPYRPWIFDLANPGDILSIQFASSLNGAPVDALDASQTGDRSVLAWAVPSGKGKEIIIAADGKIQAPADCSYLFAYCENLTSIQFNGCLDTSRVTDMSGMFYCCESLEELDVTSFDTGNVTNMGSMFDFCGRLTRLDLSSFDTRRVSNMAGMFSGCRKLEYLDLSGFDTSHVTNMDCMFQCCDELSTVKIGVLDMQSVERADSIFSGCPKLDLGSLHIKTNRLKAKSEGSTNLLYDVLGYQYGFDTVTFRTSLAGAPADAWDFSEYQDGSVLGWIIDNNSSGELIIAADGKIIAPGNCAGMFRDYEYLREIHFNNSLDTSNTVDMSQMFAECSALERLDLSGFDTSCVSDMSGMFEWCEMLEEVNVSSFDTSNVWDMTAMFGACYTLKRLDISNFDMSNVRKVERMFWACSALQELKVTVLDMSNVTSSAGMFDDCPALDTGKIPFNPTGWTWDELK